MLNVLRRNAGSWFIKAILSFIALTFIIWGVGNYGDKDYNVAAVVGKDKISMNELADTEVNLERQYRELYGPSFTPEISRMLGLRKQAINMLIRQRIMLLEARKMGIGATDDEVQQNIAATPAFQAGGKFNNDIYLQLLAQRRLSTTQYESAMRTEIVMKKLTGVLTSGASVPESEARELFFLSARKIRALVVGGNPANMKILPPSSNDEMLATYERVKESFRIPARMKLAVAVFTPEHFGREINPSEDEIKAYYEGNTGLFLTEEQRLVSRIVVSYTKKNKEELHEKISRIVETETGRDGFDDAAKKLGRQKTAESWVSRKDVEPALADALFQAQADAIVGPADNGAAFVLAHVSRIRFPDAIPLAQAQGRVVEQLRLEKGRDVATIKAYETHPDAVASKDLGAATATRGVKTLATGWIDESGSAEAPSPIAQDALMLAEGEVGPVKTIGDRHYLYQVLAKEDSRIPTLDQIRPQIIALVMRDLQIAGARAALQQTISGSSTTAELYANARKAGLTVEATDWFAPVSDELPQNLIRITDPQIRKNLALLSPDNMFTPIFETPDGAGVAVAFLLEHLASEKDWEAEKDIALQALREQDRNNIVEAFVSDRMKHYKVTIKQEDLK